MIEATPIRDQNERDELLSSIGVAPGENELLIQVTEGKVLHCFCLFQFVQDHGRITRIITMPACEDFAIDLGIRASLNLLDRAGIQSAYYAPQTEELKRIALSLGFEPSAGSASDLALSVPSFFRHPCN